MGEARRRKAAIEQLKKAGAEWEASLSSEERTIKEVALRVHQYLVTDRDYTGGCYHLAFFLHRYLHDRKGIDTEVCVGYVNDGAGPIMTSHGWLVYRGRKTDISLTKTEVPEAQLPGGLLVLDHVLKRGKANYTYHAERDEAALVAVRALLDSDLDVMTRRAIENKESEHLQMQTMVGRPELIQRYLQSAPGLLSYDTLAAAIDR